MPYAIRFMLASFVVTALLVAVVMIHIANEGVARLASAQDQSMLGGQVVERVFRLRSAVERQVVGERGYVITERSRALETWLEGARSFDKNFKALQVLDRDTHDQALLAEIERLNRDYQLQVARIATLINQGRADAAAALVARSSGPTKNALIQKVDALIAHRQERAKALSLEADQAEWNTRNMLWGAAGLLLPLLVGLAGWVGYRTLRPLRDLKQCSEAISAGHWHARVPVRHADELGHVALAFNTMASQVEHVVARLEKANRDLREADRHKDEFLDVVSHELRTPLNAVLGFGSFLQDEVGGPLTPQQHGHVEKVLEGGERMLRLVNDLVDMARVQAGKLDVRLEPTPVRELIAAVVEEARDQALEKRVAFSWDAEVAEDDMIDPDLTRRALAKLVDNAIKFTPEGGEVRIVAREDGEHLRIEVQDTGSGIPPEHEACLFGGFRQGDMSRTREVGGLGLGLTLSKAYIEAQGGRIGAAKREGIGYTMWIELPARRVVSA